MFLNYMADFYKISCILIFWMVTKLCFFTLLEFHCNGHVLSRGGDMLLNFLLQVLHGF